MADDTALVRRAASGDRRAFSALMGRHKAMLAAYVRRYVREPDDALDVVQESFVAAWRGLGGYDARLGHFEVWLRRIALNRCRDRARRAAVRALFVRAPEDAERAPDPAPGGEARALARERLGALERAIAALPAGLRDPLVLTALEGLSQREAAQVLGVSPKAVELRVARARQRLSQELARGGM